jgi:hypothetical protein
MEKARILILEDETIIAMESEKTSIFQTSLNRKES